MSALPLHAGFAYGTLALYANAASTSELGWVVHLDAFNLNAVIYLINLHCALKLYKLLFVYRMFINQVLVAVAGCSCHCRWCWLLLMVAAC